MSVLLSLGVALGVCGLVLVATPHDNHELEDVGGALLGAGLALLVLWWLFGVIA